MLIWHTPRWVGVNAVLKALELIHGRMADLLWLEIRHLLLDHQNPKQPSRRNQRKQEKKTETFLVLSVKPPGNFVYRHQDGILERDMRRRNQSPKEEKGELGENMRGIGMRWKGKENGEEEEERGDAGSLKDGLA